MPALFHATVGVVETHIAIRKYRTIHTNVASSLQIRLSLLSQQTRARSSRTCRLHCQLPKVLNEAMCRCECLETDCPPLPPKTLNTSTCRCECPNHCSRNRIQNPTMCRCECPEDPRCLPPDRDSGTCQCDGAERQCEPNEMFNHDNCHCQCRLRQRDCSQYKTLN